MIGTVWLASYPKSGNTWLRLLLASLMASPGSIVDINTVSEHSGIASLRSTFDNILLLESGILTDDEIESLRPLVYRAIMQDRLENGMDEPVLFLKVHDAYMQTPDGVPLMGGAEGACGAIVIVRDPRDIALSLASHTGLGIDEAIALMNNRAACFGLVPGDQSQQLRQRLTSWSDHVDSWLDQRDIPVHLVRYEDLKSDTAHTIARAMAFAEFPVSDRQAESAMEQCEFGRLQRQEQDRGFREWSPPVAGRRFFRKGLAGGWRDELNRQQIARIERDHGAAMRRLGYILSEASDDVMQETG